MVNNLTDNNISLQNILAAINELPNTNSIAIDSTLTKEGQAADAKVVGDKFANHTQTASTITAGTFAGAVVAQRNSQTYSSYLLRNSTLTTSATNPSYNGEICWTYE